MLKPAEPRVDPDFPAHNSLAWLALF